jgi:hypothetical protein
MMPNIQLLPCPAKWMGAAVYVGDGAGAAYSLRCQTTDGYTELLAPEAVPGSAGAATLTLKCLDDDTPHDISVIDDEGVRLAVNQAAGSGGVYEVMVPSDDGNRYAVWLGLEDGSYLVRVHQTANTSTVPVETPETPTGLTVTALFGVSTLLNFTLPTAGSVARVRYRYNGGTAADVPSDIYGSEDNPTPPDATGYQAALAGTPGGLANEISFMEYSLRAETVDGSLYSDWTAWVQAPPSGLVTDLAASADGQNVILDWTALSENATVTIYVSSDAGATFYPASPTVTGSDHTFTDVDILSYATAEDLRYYLAAANSGGSVPIYSNTAALP